MKVFSSHISEVNYDGGDLTVTYRGGKTSRYAGVPSDVANLVMTSPSIGSAIHSHIRGRYDHRYD